MQTKDIVMFAAVAILVGSIFSMTTSDVVATQTGNSSNRNTNTNTNDCPENGSTGDDADEPGDTDVNDEEDTDTGNEDAGEANDDEEQTGGTAVSTSTSTNSTSTNFTSTNTNSAGAPEPPAFDPCNFSNEEIIDNPYLTFTPGTTFTYESETEEGTEEDIVVVTNETKEILGITARVVRDTVYLDGELIEDTFDWFAQDKEGNVWYLGEDTKEYENGEVVSTEGSWEAGVDGARAGHIMLAAPQVGDTYRQEWYPEHAEDVAEVISLNESVTVPFGSFTNCLQTREFSTLDPELNEYKYYCTDVGGVTLEQVIDSGETVELIDVTQTGATDVAGNSATAAVTSDSETGATDDADEPGDTDVNDEEDTDTGNEDEGEANDDEEEGE
jgi:uncharacterized protein YuzE